MIAKYNEDIAKNVEQKVIEVFGCRLYDIVQMKDTFEKKVLVFILKNLYSFDKHNIGKAYSMSYLYVPTVCEEIEQLFLLDPDFRKKMVQVAKLLNFKFSENENKAVA